MSEAEKRDVTAALYEAALQPEAWPSALTQLGDMIGGTWSVLAAFGRDLPVPFVTQDAAGDATHLAFFTSHYNDPATNPAIPRLMAAAPGTIILREETMSDAEWARIGLYREVYRPIGVHHSLGACILNDESHVVVLGISRPARCGRYTNRELAVLRQALPHLQRSMQISFRLGDLQSYKTAYETLWDSMASGVILLDRDSKVLWANQAASSTLTSDDGLANRNGCLAAASAKENIALQALISAAVATSQGRHLSPGGSLSLSRPSRARPLALLISPIRLEPGFVRRPAAVVFVTDPGRQPVAASEVLRQLYGLTRREAALAALLVRVVDLREAAEQLGVSMHTARTQLRFIFRKTDTCRQSELVALLLRGPAGLFLT